MLINNKNLSDFNGIFISFVYAPSTFTSNLFVSNYSRIDAGKEISPGNRDLVIVFESEIDISNFFFELSNQSIIDIGDGYIYDCYLTKEPVIKHLGCRKYEVAFTLSCVCKKPLVTINNKTFTVEGNYEADCIYEITSTKNLATFTVDGYTIKNLKANRVFVLDGIDKLVYYKDNPTISTFDDTDILTFPKLSVCLHNIITSDESVKIVVMYYPMYL